MAADDQQPIDELALRDLPGKLAILISALATLALGWEVWGVLFHFGSFLHPLNLNDLAGVALFTLGWLGILVGLLVMRHRHHDSAN